MANRELLNPVNLSGLQLETPVMNGAGPVKLPEHVLEVAKSDASAVVVGSITLEERLGNQGRSYYGSIEGAYSLNSKGLPNPGMEYYRQHLPEMVQIAHDHGKPLIVSIAGFSPEEYARLSEVVLESGADGQEFNFGCPNVWGNDGRQKRITSYDPDLTGETLRVVEEAVGMEPWTAVKVSPFSDPVVLEAIASILAKSRLVKAVTSINAFPNAFAYDQDEQAAIEPAGGLAGLTGGALKPIGLGQVKQLRAQLPEAIAVIGVGGISNRGDIGDYLRVGASATQITTAYINFGPSVFEINS